MPLPPPLVVPPPAHYPDLRPALVALLGAAGFGLAYVAVALRGARDGGTELDSGVRAKRRATPQHRGGRSAWDERPVFLWLSAPTASCLGEAAM